MGRHGSFFIMAASAASLYLANIFLSVNLNAHDYGKYAIFISIISIANGFGFFGLDQALVRTSFFSSEKKLVLNSSLIRLAGFASIGFLVCSVLYGVYEVGLPGLSLAISVFATTFGLAGYAYGRVTQAYSFSQFSHGGSRVLFLVSVLAFTQLNANYEVVAWCYAIASVGVGVFSIYFFRKGSFEIKSAKKLDIGSFAVGYFFSMLIMNFIGFADRFVIQNALGLEKAAAFFFYSNIYIYPFSLLASYVGFKELSKYKQGFVMGDLHGDLLKAVRVFCGVALLCCISDYIGSSLLGGFKFSLSLEEKILMLLLGGGRIVYSSLSAVLGAVMEAKALNKVNIMTALAIFIAWLILEFSEKTVTAILVLFLWVWFARSAAVYAFIRRASRLQIRSS